MTSFPLKWSSIFDLANQKINVPLSSSLTLEEKGRATFNYILNPTNHHSKENTNGTNKLLYTLMEILREATKVDYKTIGSTDFDFYATENNDDDDKFAFSTCRINTPPIQLDDKIWMARAIERLAHDEKLPTYLIGNCYLRVDDTLLWLIYKHGSLCENCFSQFHRHFPLNNDDKNLEEKINWIEEYFIIRAFTHFANDYEKYCLLYETRRSIYYINNNQHFIWNHTKLFGCELDKFSIEEKYKMVCSQIYADVSTFRRYLVRLQREVTNVLEMQRRDRQK